MGSQVIPMDITGVAYTFSARVWYSEWYFVSLPQDMAGEIKIQFKSLAEGWGRLQVTANVGSSTWKTAIWFDTKRQTYLLALKKEIRMRENIGIDTEVQVTLWI
ncbi:MAG: DUF1905 domain-containing protein [Clostridiales bacterium]|nr:DUF1905 domain-containing protein [Clostridiales bacterium]